MVERPSDIHAFRSIKMLEWALSEGWSTENAAPLAAATGNVEMLQRMIGCDILAWAKAPIGLYRGFTLDQSTYRSEHVSDLQERGCQCQDTGRFQMGMVPVHRHDLSLLGTSISFRG